LQLPVPVVTKTFANALQLSFDQDANGNGHVKLCKTGIEELQQVHPQIHFDPF